MSRTIPFARHAFTRLRQLGCHSLHGVPGDFFLRALDFVKPSGLKWIGNANELCAAYAADAYARAAYQRTAFETGYESFHQAPKVGALFTTYGVGELSAINAVAGSYAEHVPVVHLVGTPSRRAMRHTTPHRLVHHSLGDGRMDVFADMAKSVTCAQANLYEMDDAVKAVQAYDETLEKAVHHSKPVYVSLPYDLVEHPVPRELLEKPLHIDPPANNAQTERALVSTLLEKLRASRRPLIIADGLSYPFNLQNGINDLVKLTGIPTMSFVFGKGVVDETLPAWDPALPNTTDYSRSADLVLLFGPSLSDTGTARWSAIPDVKDTVMFNLDSVEVGDQVHKGVRSDQVLNSVVSALRERPDVLRPNTASRSSQAETETLDSTSLKKQITQDFFWTTISSFLRSFDTLIFSNGTPVIGGKDIRLPTPTQVIVSGIWYSIGQMLPAAQGVAAAKRDHKLPGRTVFLEADGNFQVTCQSISDIIRNKLDVTIFLINNGGYTYERWINGMHEKYNDIPSWRYTDAPAFFGAKPTAEYPITTRTVRTDRDLVEAIADEEIGNGRGLKIIEVIMDIQDVPEKAKPGLILAGKALRSD